MRSQNRGADWLSPAEFRTFKPDPETTDINSRSPILTHPGSFHPIMRLCTCYAPILQRSCKIPVRGPQHG